MSSSLISRINGLEVTSSNSMTVFMNGNITNTNNPLEQLNLLDYKFIKDTVEDKSQFPKVRPEKFNLVLSSFGGSLMSAGMIIDFLHDHFNEVNVIIPSMALSAAAFISFGATNLYYNPTAITGEFIYGQGKIQAQNLPFLFSSLLSTVSRGGVIPSQHILAFFQHLYTLRVSNGHNHHYQFQPLINQLAGLGIHINTHHINNVNNNILNATGQELIDIDRDIRTFLKANNRSKFLHTSNGRQLIY